MKFDEKRRYVQEERQRAREAGCRSCGKKTLWLILEGSPGLLDMLRLGVSTAALDKAMEERGWYCRACVAERTKLAAEKLGILTAADGGLAAAVMDEPPLSEQEKKDAHQRKLMAQCKAEDRMPEGYTVGPDGLHWVEIIPKSS